MVGFIKGTLMGRMSRPGAARESRLGSLGIKWFFADKDQIPEVKTMTAKIRDALSWLNRRIPMSIAANWDNTGLLLGDPESPLGGICTCLTLTAENVKFAIQNKVNFILTHHPILFKGAKSLVSSRPEGRMILDLVRAGISVFSPHTAWDNAPGGINEQLVSLLGGSVSRPIRPIPGPESVKVVVFAPVASREAIARAMFDAGAGRIGNYSGCSFRVSGTGTFFGEEGAAPVVGQKGQMEEVSEERLEVICSKKDLCQVIFAMRSSHPYEEPAFDIVPLVGDPGRIAGEGRIGCLPGAVPLGELAEKLGKGVGAGGVFLVGDPARLAQTVGVACGAAGEFLADSIKLGADLFVTGELRYHDALEAQSAGTGVIVLGHHHSEQFAMLGLGRELASAMRKAEWEGCVLECPEVDPFAWRSW